jgi:hypothetical protein
VPLKQNQREITTMTKHESPYYREFPTLWNNGKEYRLDLGSFACDMARELNGQYVVINDTDGQPWSHTVHFRGVEISFGKVHTPNMPIHVRVSLWPLVDDKRLILNYQDYPRDHKFTSCNLSTNRPLSQLAAAVRRLLTDNFDHILAYRERRKELDNEKDTLDLWIGLFENNTGIKVRAPSHDSCFVYSREWTTYDQVKLAGDSDMSGKIDNHGNVSIDRFPSVSIDVFVEILAVLKKHA